eukprot:453646-Amphidinium_carterae.1
MESHSEKRAFVTKNASVYTHGCCLLPGAFGPAVLNSLSLHHTYNQNCASGYTHSCSQLAADDCQEVASELIRQLQSHNLICKSGTRSGLSLQDALIWEQSLRADQ